MLKKLILIQTALLTVLLTASCGFISELWAPADVVKDQQGGGGSSSSSPGGSSGPTVYVAGYIDNGGTYQALYWKDGVSNTLSPGVFSKANSIVLSGSNILISGYNTISPYACYWYNGDTPTNLNNSPNGSEAYSINIYNGIVYSAGYTNDGGLNKIATYWSNTTLYNLNAGVNSQANSVFVCDGTIFTAGHTNNSYACYWSNNTRFDLSGGANSGANSIYVSGGVVYTGGYTNDGVVPHACYWTNANPVPVNLSGGQRSAVNSLMVSGGTVYSCGFIRPLSPTIACYWIGTTMYILGGLTNSEAKSITVDNGTVYVAGYYSNTTDHTYHACYWKNGVLVDLGGDGINDWYATGVVVK
jgi:hypothetical protein